MDGTKDQAAAGWYPDPERPGHQRYWDGSTWTQHVAGPESDRSSQQVLKTDGFAIAGLILSIFGGVVISAVFAGIALRRIRQGTRTGKGLAIAALCINAVWVTALVVGLAVGAGDESPSADRFSGEERKIASVVDEFENAAQSDDAPKVCSLLTTEYTRSYGRKGCQRTFADELDGKVQADISVKSVRLGSPGHATARVDEGGDPLRFQMVKRGGQWKIAQIAEGT